MIQWSVCICDHDSAHHVATSEGDDEAVAASDLTGYGPAYEHASIWDRGPSATLCESPRRYLSGVQFCLCGAGMMGPRRVSDSVRLPVCLAFAFGWLRLRPLVSSLCCPIHPRSPSSYVFTTRFILILGRDCSPNASR